MGLRGGKIMFTKSDLKNGDFVEYRNGKIRMIVDDIVVGQDSYGLLERYNNNLEQFDRDCNGLDIMKVYRGMKYFDVAKEGTLLFDHDRDCKPKVEEMTLA